MADTAILPEIEPVPQAADRPASARGSLMALLARHPAIFLVFASAVYFAETCYRAQTKLFWYDEIWPYYLCRLPGIAATWEQVLKGNDLNPPLFYVLTRWSQNLFGVTELGTRVPEIIGFWIFCLCIYKFVSSRTNPIAGFIALLYPITTDAYFYAYDARPHGLVVGFFGIALLSWQALASTEGRRWLQLAILTISLTCASLCHCFAFVLLIPLGVGELALTINRRRIDFGIWFALVFPAVVSVMTVLPLMKAVKGFGDAAILARPSGLFDPWVLALSPVFGLPVFVLLGLAIPAVFPKLDRPSEEATANPAWRFLTHEKAMVAGILITPVAVFIAASIGNTPISGRYALIVSGAVACLVACAVARSKFATGLVLWMSILRIAGMALYYENAGQVVEPASEWVISSKIALENKRFDWIAATAREGDPVVIGEALNIATIFHYAPEPLRSRLVYLIPDGEDLVPGAKDGVRYAFMGKGYLKLQECCDAPGRLYLRSQFVKANRNFYVYAHDQFAISQGEAYRRLGGTVTLQDCDGVQCLWRVTLPGTNR